MNEAIAMTPNPTDLTLADTCMLAAVGLKSISTTRRADKSTEQRVRDEENDQSLTMNKHLFKKGPVRELLQLMDKAADEHRDMTAPWIDKGPRILPGHRFQDYERKMNEHKWKIEAAAKPVIANWDQHVQDDIRARQMGGQKGISITQYPTALRAARTFSMDWRVQPIPTDKDFRVQVPDYVREKQRQYLADAVEGVRMDLLKRIMVPIQLAVERLSVPIGEEGSVFRDSLIGNLKHALETVSELNVGNDPDVADAITSLRTVLQGNITPDAMRTQQHKREETAAKLAVIAKQFGGLV